MSLVVLTAQESTAVLELLSSTSALTPVLTPLLKRLQDAQGGALQVAQLAALPETQINRSQTSLPCADTNIGIVSF